MPPLFTLAVTPVGNVEFRSVVGGKMGMSWAPSPLLSRTGWKHAISKVSVNRPAVRCVYLYLLKF